MNLKPANVTVLLIIGLFIVALFFLFIVFGTEFGNRFGDVYQRKLDQATAAKVPQATLVADPDPVNAYGGVYTIDGSGFKSGTVVFINVANPTCCTSFAVWPDDLGNISFTRETDKPGIYQVETYQRYDKKLVLAATIYFEVKE